MNILVENYDNNYNDDILSVSTGERTLLRTREEITMGNDDLEV